MDDMTDWGLLRDAYGSAESIGSLLDQAESDGEEVWADLWSRLCHQGTVYTASYAALPRLTELAERWNWATFNLPLFLAAYILASTDGPDSPSAVRAKYPETVAVLHGLAQRLPQGAVDDTDFVYKVQVLLATESDSVWATNLECLANEELEFPCPSCGDQLVVSFEESPATTVVFGDTSRVARALVPANPDTLTGAEARAHTLAIACDRPKVTDQLLELFGTFSCPQCDYSSTIAAALG